MASKRETNDRDDSARDGVPRPRRAATPRSRGKPRSHREVRAAGPVPDPTERLDQVAGSGRPEAREEAEEERGLPTESDLEAQGFTADEVRQLVDISDRVACSKEARDAEAEMRRLRFTRWLIDHGVLDEWSA